jgi:hypothetical protein
MYGGFANCCGIAEVGGLDGDREDVAAVIAEGVKWATDTNRGAIIATTIASQEGAVQALRAAKFKRIRRFANPNSGGTEVSLWFKNLNKGK